MTATTTTTSSDDDNDNNSCDNMQISVEQKNKKNKSTIKNMMVMKDNSMCSAVSTNGSTRHLVHLTLCPCNSNIYQHLPQSIFGFTLGFLQSHPSTVAANYCD